MTNTPEAPPVRSGGRFVIFLTINLGHRVRPGAVSRSEGESTLYWNIAKMAVRRPRLIPYLLRAAWAFRARDWYRRPPFLPLPPRSYLAWRMETAYGDPDATPPIDDFERYLVWTAAMRTQMRRDRR